MGVKRNSKGHFIKGSYVGFGFKKKHKPWNKNLKGIHLSLKSEFKKGLIPWNKGLPEDLSKLWKGNDVGYYGLHSWVEKHLGKPKKCELCKTTKDTIYHWSNKNHEYRRSLKDWQRLCIKCHFNYDKQKFGTRKNFHR